MPLPEVAAGALLEAFDLARKEPSGALLDQRRLFEWRGRSNYESPAAVGPALPSFQLFSYAA